MFAAGSIRIVAGTLRGRKLDVPNGLAVRPTAERVREALFSILGESVVGARVLDAFSGTGALGFEAASRGAAEVTFVEADPGLVEALRRACDRFGIAGRCRVAQRRLPGALAALAGAYDLILADPPYGSPERSEFVAAVAARGLLVEGGILVVERGSSDAPAPAPPPLDLRRSARYGDTTLDLYGSPSDRA